MPTPEEIRAAAERLLRGPKAYLRGPKAYRDKEHSEQLDIQNVADAYLASLDADARQAEEIPQYVVESANRWRSGQFYTGSFCLDGQRLSDAINLASWATRQLEALTPEGES